MAETPSLKGIPRKRVMLGALALVLFLLGLALVMQGLIDTRNFREEITKIIQIQTGRKVVIRGNVSVSLLPTPTLYVPGVELRDLEDDEFPAPSAMIEMIRIRVSLMSLISQEPRITNIDFEKPVMEVVRADDNMIHWDWVNHTLLTSMAKGGGGAIEVRINQGRIIYRDVRTEDQRRIESINVTVVNGSSFRANGSFAVYGHSMSFNLNTDGISAENAALERPLSFSVSSDDESSLSLQGNLSFKDEMPVVKGQLEVALSDALSWVKPRTEDESGLFEMVTGDEEKNKTRFPMKFAGDLLQVGLTGEIANLKLQGLNSAGIGTLSLAWSGWKPAISASMHFSAMDYGSWEYLVKSAVLESDAAIVKQYRSGDEAPASPLPKDVVLNLDVKADEVYFGEQSWRQAVLSASLESGAVTVHQFSIALPGESSLTLFGVISPSATMDLRFEGSMETQGQSLRNMLTVLDGSASELPETGFGSFFAHSNIFISREQLRLSEADVKLSDLHLNGGMVFYFDVQPRVEADVQLKNINFDYFRDAWREQESKNMDKGKDFFLKFDKSNMNFNWLKRLTTVIDFRVRVDRFTFFEHPGTNASFRIYARQGDFGIYDINFIYPTDIMRGTFRLNVMGEKPLFNLSFSASEIDTGYFSYENSFIAEEERKKRQIEEERLVEAAQRKAEREKVMRDKAKAEQDAYEALSGQTASGTAAQGSIIEQNPEQPITEAMPKEELPADHAMKALSSASATTQLPPLPPGAQDNSASGTLTLVPQAQRIQLKTDNPVTAPQEESPPREAAGIEDLVGAPRARIDTVLGGGVMTELIDMSWMSGVSGVLDLNISKLVHQDIVLNNFRLQANFSNELMNFKTLTFNYWGGQVSVAGSMYGGKVPGFSISLAFLNGDFGEVMQALAGRDNLSGGISVSATIATSGVNFLSWLQQADGKMVVAVRGMAVRGFNLSGVTDAVNASRTSSDVANSVGMVIGSGSTNFAMDGNINIKNGMLRTPGMNLRSETIAGVLTGEVRLIKWYMDLSSMFQFPGMSSDTIPTLTVQLTGPIDKGEMRVDTSSLEAYVAKRIISK